MTWSDDISAQLELVADELVDFDDPASGELVVFYMECEWALADYRAARAQGFAQPDHFPGHFS